MKRLSHLPVVHFMCRCLNKNLFCRKEFNHTQNIRRWEFQKMILLNDGVQLHWFLWNHAEKCLFTKWPHIIYLLYNKRWCLTLQLEVKIYIDNELAGKYRLKQQNILTGCRGNYSLGPFRYIMSVKDVPEATTNET